ncbi:ComF family protein [Holophaga foetida]|uniref:ComF family protein n=1 Tax=Holophaga foetida TaxID=35839 RepID=UPI0002472AA1|nr:phosphoribosyltransferase family protein [Holophaga foetida]
MNLFSASQQLALLLRSGLRCRGCLGPLDRASEAGLCGGCWEGLLPLPELRCPRCALEHDPDQACPEPVAWEWGDAFWGYHGGRPPLGALLLPGIKNGELGWKKALLRRASAAPLPDFAREADLVTSAPATRLRRFMRGFDLAEEFGKVLAKRTERPWHPLLRKAWRAGRQGTRNETDRRRLPQKAIQLARRINLDHKVILLVDDVWTTGTTLLRCAQALKEGGAQEVRVLSIFRAL